MCGQAKFPSKNYGEFAVLVETFLCFFYSENGKLWISIHFGMVRRFRHNNISDKVLQG